MFISTNFVQPDFLDEPDRSSSDQAHDLKAKLMNKLYNAMKIAEMPKYGIDFFEKTLGEHQARLTERDFIELTSSYWCRQEHLKAMVKRRGTRIANGRLKLCISQDILSMVVDSGSGVGKIICMLEQRRKDLEYDPKQITKLERDFFIRNCRRRWWNHELPIRAFAISGWLTVEYAQLGLERFAKFMIVRAKKNQSHSIHLKWENLTELLASHGATFKKIPVCLSRRIQLAYKRGVNTYEFTSKSVTEKNDILHNILNIKLPEEIWSTIVSRMVYV